MRNNYHQDSATTTCSPVRKTGFQLTDIAAVSICLQAIRVIVKYQICSGMGLLLFLLLKAKGADGSVGVVQ